MSIQKRIDELLLRLVGRLPRQVIGKDSYPYHLMERYHLLHFAPGWRPFFPETSEDKEVPKLVLHRFLRGDDCQKGIHTHPWWCLSLVVLGGYVERYLRPVADPLDERKELVERTRGWLSLGFNRLSHAHVVTGLTGDGPCWTLALLGPWEQAWGFPEVGQVVRDGSGRLVGEPDAHARCYSGWNPERCAICNRSRAVWLDGAGPRGEALP